MTRMDWTAIGERFYESGVDRGVLYVGTDDGVPWVGLISVNELNSTAERKAYYLDGVNYLNRLIPGEFEATIEAYTYPEEFRQCDGTLTVGNGLFITQQRRKSFGLSYRTRIGNDTMGLDYAYKIHIVYNASAKPSDHDHRTLTEAASAFNFSWAISTKPAVLSNLVPSAHFIIDSRETPEALLGVIEDILYGSTSSNPRLPDAGELRYLFETYGNMSYDAEGPLDDSFYTVDGGGPVTTPTSTVDGGTPFDV